MPKNKVDAATLMHDIDYMLATDNDQARIADEKAIARSDWSLPGIATKIGLTVRKNLLPGSFYGGDPVMGAYIKDRVKQDPVYKNVFEQYSLGPDLTEW